ncbi:MAG: M23 family metallopeptidase [Patescibacteria group bacterium]|nr:M23 family metallopeptidase [Patescibacteria group bacterium]
MSFVAMLGALISVLAGAIATAPQVVAPDFAWPLDAMDNRPKLLTFGLYVTPNPDNNPIDPPERWTGYHSALDIEIYPDEIDKDVPVYAVCNGPVIFTGEVNGYGGVIIQSCEYESEPITVLYGHINPYRIEKKVDDILAVGDRFGVLGGHKNRESGYNRKHLHMQMHRGSNIVFQGYVSSPQELSAYIDPQKVINSK